MSTAFYSHQPNGRVSQVPAGPDLSKLFAMRDPMPAKQCASLREPTLGQWTDTPLSRAFFSAANIQLLQNGLRAGVYRMSNGQYTVGPQDCDSLKIIMRSVFLSHAVNLPTDITQQIRQLNQVVLDDCVPRVYKEAQSYIKYLRDISTLPVPLSTPVLESQRDKVDYELPAWF